MLLTLVLLVLCEPHVRSLIVNNVSGTRNASNAPQTEERRAFLSEQLGSMEKSDMLPVTL